MMSMEGREENAESEPNESDESTHPEEKEKEEELDAVVVVDEIQRVMESVVQFGEYRRTRRKESHNLARRFKHMLPLMEELRDLQQPVPQDGVVWLIKLRDSLSFAKDLLKLCSQGSKIHLVNTFIRRRFVHFLKCSIFYAFYFPCYIIAYEIYDLSYFLKGVEKIIIFVLRNRVFMFSFYF